MTMEIIPGPNAVFGSLRSFGPGSVLPAVAFSVNKNGVTQTGIPNGSFTTVTWPNESFDTGSYFASNVWTPPSGIVFIVSQLLVAGTINTGAQISMRVTPINTQGNFNTGVANSGFAMISTIDQTDGSKSYGIELYVAGTSDLIGTNVNTYFQGFWLGS